MQGCAGGDSYGNAFLLGEELRRGKGVLIGCAEDLAVDLRVQDFGDKARADALDLVGAASALGEDRGPFRFECHNFDIGILRLQIFTYAGQRAARSDTCDEDIYLAVGVAPDLWTGGRPVDRRVGRIDELAGNKAVRDLQRQLGGLGDRALHALGALCEDKLRSVCFQNIASLHAHGLGHRQNNAVALRGCDRRKTDTGIAGCGLNDRGAFSQQTLGFRVFDHRLGDAVLYASRGIEVLKFHKDFRFQSKVSLNICDL